MAERAAHVTSTTHPRPSALEVVAQQSLGDTIYPALQRFLQFLAQSRPESFALPAAYCDELYLGISAAVQYHYLNKQDASFSEYFYGLRRVTVDTDSNSKSLTSDERNLSMLYLVLLPYLKIKIEQRLAIYRLELADNILIDKWEILAKKFLCSIQCCAQIVGHAWAAVQLVRYMSGARGAQTPALHLAGLQLTYRPPEKDHGFWGTLFRHPLCWSCISWTAMGSGALSSALELGAFFVQFLQAWQSDDKHRDIAALPKPPPPPFEPRGAQYRGVCPLCLQVWRVPTVLAVSGYVFCYRCLTRHLETRPSCPVTGLPASLAGVLRLYLL